MPTDGQMPLDVALRAVARQNQETLAFLHDLTEYNMAIAQLRVGRSARGHLERRAGEKLVIARSTRRDS